MSKLESNKKHHQKWDNYFQDKSASHAVRNRAHYFCNLTENLVKKNPSQKIEVANIASGPGRDMLYFFQKNSAALINFDCIEQDPNAINYARELNAKHLEKINFIVKNVLRFKSQKKYDLIWSAGLFDYFDDERFVFMLKKLRSMISENGEIVIGNFSTKNPDRAYMELFEWHLHHRSPQNLLALAKAAGYEEDELNVKMERLGVNLFLHIRRVFN